MSPGFFRSFVLMVLLVIGKVVAAQRVVPDSLFQQALRALRANEYDRAIPLYLQYLQLPANRTDSLKRGNALIGIGVAHDKSGRYDEALDYYFRGLKVYEAIHNERKIAGALKDIGSSYREFRAYDKALDFLFQALHRMESIPDSAGMANIYDDIGITYLQQDSVRQSIYFLSRAAGPLAKFAADDVRLYAYNNLATAYDRAGRYKEALAYFESALALDQKLDDKFAVAILEGNIATIYSKMGDGLRAVQHGKKALEIAGLLRSNLVLEATYGNLADLYDTLRDYKAALYYRSKQMTVKDSIFREESLKKYAEMDAKYQTERKQQQIVTLQQQSRIDQLELRTQQRTKYFMVGGLVLLLVIAVSAYRSYRIKQRANRELGRLNSQLADANQSKTRLFNILSHDLRGPVSSLFNFLQLQKGRRGRAESDRGEEEIIRAADYLLETMEDLLIWSKSQLENLVPFVEPIEVASLLREVTDLFQPAAEMKAIKMKLTCTEGLILSGDINFLRVVLRNLVSNSLKFTPEGGTVELSGQMREDGTVISVKDSGPGIPADAIPQLFDWNSIRSDATGLGLKLAKDFIDRMRGRITVISGPGGTDFQVVF